MSTSSGDRISAGWWEGCIPGSGATRAALPLSLAVAKSHRTGLLGSSGGPISAPALKPHQYNHDRQHAMKRLNAQ